MSSASRLVNDHTADDYVSTYSSKGPTLIDHYLKPDLLAPGNRFIAPISVHSKLEVDLPERIAPCGPECTAGYLELSGTSMAAGVVSGTVALMLSQDPSLGPDTVKARLMRSARKMTGNALAIGAGVLDITAALNDPGVMANAALSPKLMLDENAEQIRSPSHPS